MNMFITRHGCVQPIRPNDVEPDDVPVTVIPTDDFERLVALLGALKRGGSWYPEIDAIIEKVEAGNE